MKTTFRWLAALCAMAAMIILAPQAALAAAKVRVEYVRAAPGSYAAGVKDGAVRNFLGQQTISGIGGTQVLSAAAPDFKAGDYPYRNGLARLTVISGAVVAAWGDAPTVTETTGIRLEAGQSLWVALDTGQKLALIEAADAPAFDASAVTAVADALLRSAIASGNFVPAPGSYLVTGCVRDTSGSNLSNLNAKATACDVKGQQQVVLCIKDTTSCLIAAAVDASVTGSTVLPFAMMGACHTDGLPATANNDQFTNARVDCKGGQSLTNLYAQKSDWWHAYLARTDAAETLIKAANTTLENCITGVSISWGALGAASAWEIRDGAGGTVLRGGDVTTTAGSFNPTITTPHCGTVNTGLYFKLLSTINTGTVRVTIDGVLMKP